MTRKTRSSHQHRFAFKPVITIAAALVLTGLVTGCGNPNNGYSQQDVALCGADTRTRSVLTTDLNDDGVDDAAVGCLTVDEPLTGHLAIWLSDGDGTLEQSQTIELGTHETGGEGAHVTTAADFNEDGNPDLVVLDKAGNKHRHAMIYGSDDGTFGEPEYFERTIRWTSASDVNDDGHQDLIIAITRRSRTFLPGDGDKLDTGAKRRYMGPPTDLFQSALINGDGRLDAVALIGKSHTLRVFPSGGAAYDLALKKSRTNITRILSGGRADGDDIDDLLVQARNADGQTQVRWLLTEGGPHFGDPIARASEEDVWRVADYNRDGEADLVVKSGEDGNQRSLLMGQADGEFAKTGTVALPGGLTGWTPGDFNADGIPDFVYRYLDEDDNHRVRIFISQAG